MTGARLTAVLDDKQFEIGIGNLTKLMRDTTPVMRAIGVKLASSTEARLGGTTDPLGNPWPALNPAYAAIKTQPGMLKERGIQGGLQSSITFDAGHNVVFVGSNRVYAAIHQFGGKILPKNGKFLAFSFGPGGKVIHVKSVTIPARPYLGISVEDEISIVRVVDVFYLRALESGRP